MENINETLKNLPEEKKNAVKVLIGAKSEKTNEISNTVIRSAERILNNVKDKDFPLDKEIVNEYGKWYDTNQTYMDVTQLASISKDYNIDLNQNGISDKLEKNEQQDLNQNGVADKLEKNEQQDLNNDYTLDDLIYTKQSFVETMKTDIQDIDLTSVPLDDLVHEIYVHKNLDDPFRNVSLQDLEKVGLTKEKLLLEPNDILNKLSKGEKTDLIQHKDNEFKLAMQDNKFLVYPKIRVEENKLYPDTADDLNKLKNNDVANIKVNGKDYVASLDKENNIISGISLDKLRSLKEVNNKNLSSEQIEKLSRGESVIIGKDNSKLKLDFNNTKGFSIINETGKKENKKIGFRMKSSIQDETFKRQIKNQASQKVSQGIKPRL